jgi:hypothetical protein
MHLRTNPPIELDYSPINTQGLNCSTLSARAMPPLPIELLALVVRLFYAIQEKATEPTYTSLEKYAQDTAFVRQCAKPLWADVESLATSSRALRALALEQWFSVFVVPLPLDQASVEALLAFPPNFHPHWVRYTFIARYRTSPARRLITCVQDRVLP